MRISASESITPVPLMFALLAAVAAPVAATAQEPAPTRIVASQVQLSRESAELRLELENGEEVAFSLTDGVVRVDGEEVGDYERADALDQSWRELLNRVMETPNEELAPVLEAWAPPAVGETGGTLDRALAAIAQGAAADGVAPGVSTAPDAPGMSDSVVDAVVVERLQSRIDELEIMLDDLEDRPQARQFEVDRGSDWTRPLRYVGRGFSGILATLALFAVLVGLGFGAVFFGRTYLEGVADTARRQTLRSWAVGFAATFLTVPVFILGTIALAISIVGIPVLIAWLPLFPVAVGLAALFGYLAVAHAGGEALAERRLHGVDWYRRGNSYYYVMTGLGLLLVVFIAAHIIQMAGPLLGFLHGLLMFIGVVVTWAAITIGFGAVLLSRAGTRPAGSTGVGAEPEGTPSFEEEPHV